eukprot:2192087-Amphidinium_carterae.2
MLRPRASEIDGMENPALRPRWAEVETLEKIPVHQLPSHSLSVVLTSPPRPLLQTWLRALPVILTGAKTRLVLQTWFCTVCFGPKGL